MEVIKWENELGENDSTVDSSKEKESANWKIDQRRVINKNKESESTKISRDFRNLWNLWNHEIN